MGSAGRTQATCVNLGDEDQNAGALEVLLMAVTLGSLAPLSEAVDLCKPLELRLNPFWVIVAHISSPYTSFSPPTQSQLKKMKPGFSFFSQGSTHSKHSMFIFQFYLCPQYLIGNRAAWLFTYQVVFQIFCPCPQFFLLLLRSRLLNSKSYFLFLYFDVLSLH